MSHETELVIPLSVLRFPFLGTRKGGEPFEYLLMSLSNQKAQIAIFDWMVNQTILMVNERIELFLPIQLNGQYDFRNNVSGLIASIQQNESNSESIYEIIFDKDLSNIFSHLETVFSPSLIVDLRLIDLLLKLIKDVIILKEGVIVYLQHFAPYFSRIVNYPAQDYKEFKEFIFQDIIGKIKNNNTLLNGFYLSLKEKVKVVDDISIYLNLEELRETIESEINLDLFLIAFTSKVKDIDIANLFDRSEEGRTNFRDDYYMAYLLAIKNLEKRLYFNYNQVVSIYMKSIG